MTAVITVPSSLDDLTFENVLEQLAPYPTDAKVIIDARHTGFATPFGLTAMLTLGQTRTTTAEFLAPDDPDVASYWARSGFFRFADQLFELRGTIPRPRSTSDSDVLLEMTPIVKSDDVHVMVERIKDKATDILVRKLHLESRATMGFVMALSEACQNIVEHAGRGGWVMVQTYRYKKRLHGRWVMVFAVCDAGVGFRRSLEMGQRRPVTDRWDDAAALEAAVINGVSRHTDSGRGQGIKGIRGYIHRHDGKFTVRSGTARIAIIPPWDDDIPRQGDLAHFPGAQLLIAIPEKVGAAA